MTCPARPFSSKRLHANSAHLVIIDLDEGSSARLDLVHQQFPIFRRHGVAAQHREVRAEAHDDIGVVDRAARLIMWVEQQGGIIEPVVEVGDYRRMGSRTEVRVGAALRPVEHEAAGALEEMAVPLVEAEVDRALHLEAARGEQRLDLVRIALEPPCGRRHRVEDHRPVGMEAHPIVREHRIGLGGIGVVVEQHHLYSGCVQRLNRRIELAKRAAKILAVAEFANAFDWAASA